jgi:uncharacterized protein
MITGTSTGGILALGLGLDLSAERMLGFYQENASKIFPSTGVRAMVRQVIRPKHAAKKLHGALKDVLGGRKLGESRRPLVINAYNASRDGPHLFKTYHHRDHYRHYEMSAADIALATAAAPLFFRLTELPLGDHGEDQTFVDGGIWANCPVLVGIAEARRYFHTQIDTIDVLSVGTTYKPFRIKDIQKTGGIAQWRLALISLLFSAQQASAVGTANTLLNRPVCRIQREVDMEMPLDTTDPEQLNQLVEWGRRDAGKVESELKQRFFYTEVPPFIPENAKFAEP